MTISKTAVRLEMAKKGMLVKDFCKVAGISTNRFYIVLNSRNITANTAVKFAKALGVDVTEILAGEKVNE